MSRAARRTITHVRRLDAVCDLIRQHYGNPDRYPESGDTAQTRAVRALGLGGHGGDLGHGARFFHRTDMVVWFGAREASEALMRQLHAGHDAGHWNLDEFGPDGSLNLWDVLDGTVTPQAPAQVTA